MTDYSPEAYYDFRKGLNQAGYHRGWTRVENVITNVWSAVKRDELLGTETSRVVVDSTAVPAVRMQIGRSRVTLHLGGVRLNMPEASIDVLDGLVSRLTVDGDPPRVEVELAYPAMAQLHQVAGLPCRTVVEFDRRPVAEAFAGRRIVVDPGHGGRDTGARGPVDLLEKDLALAISLKLARLLANAGAEVALTRTADIGLEPEARRAAARAISPDAVISVHTRASASRADKGTAAAYATPEARRLAELVQRELVRKIRLSDLGVRGWENNEAFGGLPAVCVECVTISNPVEEGWLRSSTFLSRVAQGIFNGIEAYLAPSPLTGED